MDERKQGMKERGTEGSQKERRMGRRERVR